MAGIYIHIPFCHSKCHYCDFYSAPHKEDWMEAFSKALCSELSERRSEVDYIPDTLYIGGGTPSCLPEKYLSGIISSVMNAFAPFSEATIEVNPEDVTDEFARFCIDSGINRVSMGIQSFNDSELREVGRRHTAAEAIAAVGILRSAGISNISCDLIYGLPGQDIESWKKNVDTMLSLRPPHFSAYLLSYEPGTRLYARLLAGKVRQADEEEAAAMYDYLSTRSRECGYEHYEISNFALPGFRSRHNSSYWKDEPYLGLGPSAVSFDGKNRRRTNVAGIKEYIRDTSDCVIEEESDTDRINDKIFIGLRTLEGIDLATLPEKVSSDLISESESMIAAGHLILDGHHLRIPEAHWLISDSIIRDLLR